MDEIEMNLFILTSLISIFLIWSSIKFIFKPVGNKNSPPSPSKLPILGNLHQLGSLPHQTLHSLARKHGPLMLLHFGSVPVLIVSSADAAREIMRTHDAIFADRPQYKAFKKLAYDCNNITFSLYNEQWRQLKNIFSLHVLTNKRVKSLRSIREEETVLLVNKIRETAGPVNLSELFAEFTNDLISRSAFGTKYRESEKGKKLLLLVVEVMELSGTVGIGDFIPRLSWIDRVTGFDQKLDRVAKEMDDFLENVIQERIENRKEQDLVEENGENFLDIMLQLQRDDISVGRESVKALVMDVLLGGTDTSSTTLEWAMAELLRNPTVMENLQNEVRDLVKGKQDITDDDLEKMHYLKAVIKETFRHQPPVPILVPRVARKDVRIKGYDISAGTVVMVNAWSIGRDQASWDEADKFKPERFLNSTVEFKGWSFELIPFGAGRRGCPGMTYAVATIELLLANLVQKFNWALPDGAEGKDLDMSECPGLAVHRAVPLLAVATKAT